MTGPQTSNWEAGGAIAELRLGIHLALLVADWNRFTPGFAEYVEKIADPNRHGRSPATQQAVAAETT